MGRRVTGKKSKDSVGLEYDEIIFKAVFLPVGLL